MPYVIKHNKMNTHKFYLRTNLVCDFISYFFYHESTIGWQY